MVAFAGICRRFTRLAKGTVQKLSTTMAGVKGQAVSDGELNMAARGCAGSSSSLPGTRTDQAASVLSWAVSFEKLLEDPMGVRHFTAFLKSEVSAENIMFWQACEQFRRIPATHSEELKEAARFIYQTYMADSAPYSVNIDETARNEIKDLERPTIDVFDKAQAQIFRLMKMDSYRRFVRSPLYQSCTLSSVEGRALHSYPSEPAHMGSWEDVVMRSTSFSSGNKDKRMDSNSSPGGKTTWDTQRRKRGSWGAADNSSPAASGDKKETQLAVTSTSSVEPGSLYRQIEDGRSPDQGGGGRRLGVEGGYCCVFLPDGSASLAPTRTGLALRDMLAGLCEKRGFPLKDVVIYLHGRDKQPLLMDQDCSVLRDQQVTLELRVKFTLEVEFTGKTSGIMAKSSKTLQDALAVILQKHQLKPQDTLVTMAGSSEPVNMTTSTYKLANKRLRLHRIKDKDQSHSCSAGSGLTISTQDQMLSQESTVPQSTQQMDRVQNRPNKNRDMDGLLELLSRAQSCRVDDQRGPLTKEHLELPLFLQLPQEHDATGDGPAAPSPSVAQPGQGAEEQSSSASCSASIQATLNPTVLEPKNLKETTI